MNQLERAFERLQAVGISPADVEVIFDAIAQREATIAFGERSVAIGGDVEDVVIVTGDMHFNVPREAWEHLLRTQPSGPAYNSLVQQFRIELTADEDRSNISLDRFPRDFIKTFILHRLHEPHLRRRALKRYFSLVSPDEGFLRRVQKDSQWGVRKTLASCVAEHGLPVSRDLMAAMLEDESRTAAKEAVTTAYVLIGQGHFNSDILKHASGHKSWAVRYRAVKKIIATDDEASVETLCHFRDTTYHRARNRIREYFEKLHAEDRLSAQDRVLALDLLTHFETDGESSKTTEKKMRGTLDRMSA